MTSVIWSPQALLDLQSIRDYIAHDSPRYADLVVHRLVAAVERLEAFPQSGRVVPERNDEAIREVHRPTVSDRVPVTSWPRRDRDRIQGLASLSGNYVIEGAAAS